MNSLESPGPSPAQLSIPERCASERASQHLEPLFRYGNLPFVSRTCAYRLQ
jgi:hypothetical protein